MTIYKPLIAVYGRLVLAGKYTLDPQEVEKKQVPALYVPLVAEWVADFMSKFPDEYSSK